MVLQVLVPAIHTVTLTYGVLNVELPAVGPGPTVMFTTLGPPAEKLFPLLLLLELLLPLLLEELLVLLPLLLEELLVLLPLPEPLERLLPPPQADSAIDANSQTTIASLMSSPFGHFPSHLSCRSGS